MTLRAGVLAGLIACIVFAGGLWALNNTRAGLAIKCNFLSDFGACLLHGLSEPVPAAVTTPDPTVDPSVRAEQERQEAERQRREAEARVQREADAVVGTASADLQATIDALAYLAEAASTEAFGIDDPISDVEQALEDMRTEFDELASMIAGGSTGEFWVDDVSFELYDVEFARDSVDFAADGVEFSAFAIQEAMQSRDDLIRDVERAISSLESAEVRHPGGVAPYAASQGRADLNRFVAKLDLAIASYERAQRSLDDLIAEADALLEDAQSLAATVGAS